MLPASVAPLRWLPGPAAFPKVRDEYRAWVTVIEDMGLPAGKAKTIAVDLCGKFLSADRQVRFVTSLISYRDEAFLGTTPGRYTRFGNVKPLLETIDDRMVIMGSGDELTPSFLIRPLAEGASR